MISSSPNAPEHLERWGQLKVNDHFLKQNAPFVNIYFPFNRYITYLLTDKVG